MRFLLGVLGEVISRGLALVIAVVVTAVVVGVVGWIFVASWHSGTWPWVWLVAGGVLVWAWRDFGVSDGIADWLDRRRARRLS